VRDIFSKARNTAPTIVFFDEIDALAPPRGGGDGPVTDRVVAQLLSEIDGIEELKDVFLLAATNRIDCVDSALLRPGRFDRIFEVPAPDLATRASILRLHSARLPFAPEVDLQAIAAATEGLVGAELAAICQQAGRAALHRLMQGQGAAAAIVQNDLIRAVDEVKGDRRFRGARRKSASRGRSWWW
jgi:transitional endoplasmic reticulum ATPase